MMRIKNHQPCIESFFEQNSSEVVTRVKKIGSSQIITIIFDGMKRVIKNDSVIIMINCLVFIYTCFCKDVWMNDYYWNDAMFVSNVGIGLFIYNLGYIAKKHKGKVEVWLKKFGGGTFVLSIFILSYIKFELGFNYVARESIWTDGYQLIVVVIAGIYFMAYLSHIIASDSPLNIICSFIQYCGKNSMSLMYFHIPCFTVATIIIHYVTGLEFPNSWTNCYGGRIFSLFSAMCGMTIPLLVDLTIDRMRSFYMKKMKVSG